MSNITTENSAGSRIKALLDENSFVEIGGLMTARNTDFNLQQRETPADGVITGYGVIDGNLVYVFSQDASVLNGAVGEVHAKKIVHIYDMAMKMGAPVIGMIDCAGLRLQEATDALNAFGEIYHKQAMASGVIPQIMALFGACGGGLAMIPALADFTYMEKENAKLFVNSPNAIDKNSTSKCDSSSAKFQSEKVGLVDGVGTQSEIMEQIRGLVTILPLNNEDDLSYDECNDELNRSCDGLSNFSGDALQILEEISDDGFVQEMKKDYAREMVTAFIRLNGVTVGAIGNSRARGEEEYGRSLSARGCKKAARFAEFCDAFNIPILSLTNVDGYAANMCAEKNIAKAAAKLTYAFANATVPKVNVILEKAYGSAYTIMNSKALGADMVYAWTDAEIGMMEPVSAAKIMYEGADTATINQKASEYLKLQSSAMAAAKRGYVDMIIAPEDTRKYMISAFEMLFTKREERPCKKHGTV